MTTTSKIGAFASLCIVSLGASAASDLDAKLLAAAQKTNPTDVRALLAAGADANARAADGSTPMIYAAHFGDAGSVQALLGAKGDPNLTNRYGIGPMHEAALRADAGLLKILVDAGAEVDLALPQGETPLMLASRTSGVDAVRLLIEHGAKVNVVEQWQGQTPLMYAAAHDRGEVAAALIAAGADVNARTPVNDLPERKPAVRYFVEIPSAGLTPVMFAARHGAVCRFARADQGERRHQRQDAGGFLAGRDRARQSAFRCGQGAGGGGREARTAADSSPWSRLATASTMSASIQVPTGAESSLEVLKLMLSHGADLMDRLPEQLLDRDARFTPPPPKITDLALIRAARSSDVEAMRVLIEAGADPSLHDEKRGGITPLLAVMMGPELPSLIEADRQSDRRRRRSPRSTSCWITVSSRASRTTSAPRLCTWPPCETIPASSGIWPREASTSTSRIAKGFTPLDYALGHLPSKLRGKPPADITAAAAALRELGAHGKEEQRTAAR